jgi:hypothetical protein
MMPAHVITRDGYSTVIKTTVQHSPEFWRMIDRLFALDALIDLRDPLDVASAIEFEHAFAAHLDARAEYAKSIAPGCAGKLTSALCSHHDRMIHEAAERAETEWVA